MVSIAAPDLSRRERARRRLRQSVELNGADRARSAVAFRDAPGYGTPTMRRSWRTRLLTATYSLWLFVVLGELPMVHMCPAHSAGHASHAMTMPGMAQHAHAAGDPRTAPSENHSQQPCTCLGDCCCAVPAALPAPRVVVTLLAATRIPTIGRPQHDYVAAWSDFVLPFATAPPATV